jgi:hypothetical protein
MKFTKINPKTYSTVSKNVSADEMSHKLTINTVVSPMDDEIKVKISSPVSAKENNFEIDVENNHPQDCTQDKESTTPQTVVSPGTLARLCHEVTTLRTLPKKNVQRGMENQV